MTPRSGLIPSLLKGPAEPLGVAIGDAPAHVAIIMDGNGRWAKGKNLPRSLGHRAGVTALKRLVEAAPTLGVRRLTVFGFSTENWRRPAGEVSELMRLLKAYVRSDLERLRAEGVRVHILAGERACRMIFWTPSSGPKAPRPTTTIFTCRSPSTTAAGPTSSTPRGASPKQSRPAAPSPTI